MTQGHIGLDRSADSPRLATVPGAEGRLAFGAGDDIPRPGIAAPGAFCAAGATISATEVDLDDFAARRYPGLMRGMVVTVHRPWRIRAPLASALAWRIRRHQARILGLPADQVIASHAMIYAGGGNYWSQGARFTPERIEAYRGCTLYHFDFGWDLAARNALMGECGPRANQTYGYRDIAALAMWSLTGRRGWLEAIGDLERPICSEQVCELVRLIDASILGDRPCIELVPHSLHLLLTEVARSCVAIRVA